MRRAISAAIVGAALLFPGAAWSASEPVYEAQLSDPAWQTPAEEPPLPDFDRLSRELAVAPLPEAEPRSPALDAYADVVLFLTVLVALLILVSSFDDAII